ncbi:hypothetical protein Pmani_022314 [Petrolisthes manimaculis]|uniref:RNA helicase n=1 Tax=Petrolisthes manimaculis TaxID=1843537 RepID=A0AAE1PD77_9EUCA|nr:hypothetical protein Pmani_022314 [Petrolisthes manimaculis]
MSNWGSDNEESPPKDTIDGSQAAFGGFGSNNNNNDLWQPDMSDLPTEFGGGQRGGRGGGRGGRGGGRGGKCFKCQEEGHISRNCPSAGGESGFGGNDGGFGNSGGFGNGGGFGRGGGRGGKGRGCFKCGEEGHMSRECPSADGFGSGGGGGGGGGKKGCFKCGEEGHMSRECPSADGFGSGGGGGGKKGCFKCGEEGHQARECPSADNSSAKNPSDPDDAQRAPMYIPEDIDEDKLFDLGIRTGQNIETVYSMPVKVDGEEPIAPPAEGFADMGLRQIILDNVTHAGYTRPTPIQRYAIPVVMAGRDVMSCAQTGSGKTAAFLLPMLHYVIENNIDAHSFEETVLPVGLVLAPTRELAIQIHNEARKFSCGSIAKCSILYGGTVVQHQRRRLKETGCHILVGTPGRIKDFLNKGYVSLASLKFMVFDEADRMMDLGFIGDMEALVANPDLPPKGERIAMMFSATFPAEIQRCALKFMNNYVFLVVGTVGSANQDVTQEIVSVAKYSKRTKIVESLKAINIEQEKVLVFVEMKKQADFLGSYLVTQGFHVITIHGDRFQQQREEALSGFRAGVYHILVATSVAARGLEFNLILLPDIPGVTYVINYDLPKSVDEYVHRIGRTGRVGNAGKALSFYDPETDSVLAKNLVKILSDANQEVPDWMMSAADGSLAPQTYHGSGMYASVDLRQTGKQNFNNNEGPQQLGGPLPNAVTGGGGDDDFWDD